MWDTQQPASFSIFQIGGFTQSDPTPSYSIEIPRLLSYLATGSFNGKVVGLNQNQKQEAAQFGPGNYMPMIELAYWSHARDGVPRRADAARRALGRLAALARKKLERAKWFQRAAVGGIALPFLACFGGWLLTETGRQPWIV